MLLAYLMACAGHVAKTGSVSDDAEIEMGESLPPLPTDGKTLNLVQQILADLQMMTRLARKRTHECHNADEWAFIAQAFDRLFFWLFTLANVFALLAVFVLYPLGQPAVAVSSSSSK